MAGGRFPSVELALSHNYFSNFDKLADSLAVAVKDGEDFISIIFAAKEAVLPKTHPKKLRDELCQKISNAQAIQEVRVTRQGKLFITTNSTSTAQELLAVDSLLGIQVESFIQLETISTKFLLHGIEATVSCAELAEELATQGLVVLEVRRFLKKGQNGDSPTLTVLVTIIGTKLPTDIKLWFELHRISIFHDKPRQCQNCYRYNHATKSCRSNKICPTCATSHIDECTATTPTCSNCNGKHSADSKDCPSYREEVALQKFRSTNHYTLSEARRRFAENNKSSKKSFAKVVASASPDVVTKAQLKEAMQELTEQFTTMVQSVFNELRQAMQDMVSTITQPLMGAIKELQAKKSSSRLSSADLEVLRSKKTRLSELSTSMDYQPSLPAGSPPGGSSPDMSRLANG